MFGGFHTLNRTVDKVVFDRLAAVYRQGNGNDFLTCILKCKLILIGVKDIMLIGCDFLYIVAAERKVGLNSCKSVLIKSDHFDKSVSRNGSSTCRNKFLCGIQAKHNVLDFAVITDFKEVVCFEYLLHRKGCFLSFVIERGSSFSHGHILSCVDQLNGMNIGADYITVRCFDFLNLVLAEIDFFTLGKAVSSGRNGVYHFTLCITESAVRSDNIFCGSDFKDCTCKGGVFVDRLIDYGIFITADIHAEEHFAVLFYGNSTFLCHICLVDLNHSNPAFLSSRIIFRYIKIHGSCVKHIAVRSFNFHKEVTLAIRELFRGNKRAVGISIESVDCSRCWISERHLYKLTVRIENLEGCTCIRNSLFSFRIDLYHTDIALKVGVVDKVTVSGFVLSDIHLKVGHQLTTFPSANLMHSIYTVRKHLSLSEAVFITNDNITLGFLCVFVTACGF